MPTNDFEKQVQQKMEELTFVPSEAVWPAVEKQIRGRKERRRLLLWWWLLPFLAAGGSIGIYHMYHNKDEKNNLSIQQKKTTPVVTPAAADSSVARASTYPFVNNTPAMRRLYERSAQHTRIYNHKNQALIARADNYTKRNGKTEKQTDTKDKDNMQAGEEPLTSMDNEPVSNRQASLKPAIVKPLGKRIFAARPVAPPFEKGPVKKPARTKKKMEWVVTVNAGQAGISSGFSPIVKTSPALDMAPGLYANAVPPLAGVSQSFIATRPSDIRPGFSFGGGLSLRWYVSNTCSLEAGLLYSYYSNSMTIGKRVDSTTSVQQASQAIAGYYSNYSVQPSANNTDYRNQYHFIEIPIRVEKQLGLQSPLSLQAGLTIGRLLGSNALQYDAGRNIYYKDNSLFNKTQLSFSGGMDIRLWRNKPVSFELGPRFQYGLNNFFRKNAYSARHLLFVGLETRIFFRKK